MSSTKCANVAVSCAMLLFVGILSGCESLIGKTADQSLSDASITTAVQTKLTKDHLSNFPRIDVDTERGVVNLSGVVETADQRVLAEYLTHQVEGVVGVTNHLQVQNRLPSGKETNASHANEMSAENSRVIATEGTAKGETTDEPGQQGLGLSPESGISTIIMGGPEIVEGKITKIEGELFSIHGNRGQEVSLRVTKDTNKVCGSGQGTKVSTGQEGAQEQQEIPPTAFMEERASKGGTVLSEQEMMQQLHEGSTQEKVGALSKDPSTLKERVGTTDPKANEDVAKGSAFIVGGENCQFTEGDQVRVEASDMGTATTIKQLQSTRK
jgi:hyperosmotically inducible protein